MIDLHNLNAGAKFFAQFFKLNFLFPISYFFQWVAQGEQIHFIILLHCRSELSKQNPNSNSIQLGLMLDIVVTSNPPTTHQLKP